MVLPHPDQTAEHGGLPGMFQCASVAMVAPTPSRGINEFCLALSTLPKSAHEPGSTLLVRASRRFGLEKNKWG